MVKYKQKPIIDYILKATQDCGINKVAIVNGYKNKILEDYELSKLDINRIYRFIDTHTLSK